MNNRQEKGLYEQLFDILPLGLFLIDQKRLICAWNAWMTHNTKINAEIAIGQSLKKLYPSQPNQRFDWALDAVLLHGHPQLLSSTLNSYVIPIPLDKKTYSNLNIMQQNVEILPFHYQKQNMALVVIQDVTEKTHLKNTLVAMANRFEDSSIKDVLTGLYNRRFLWKYLEKELQNARQEGYSMACCIFDLDYFKKINDELGHGAGDEVLISFAKLTSAQLRSTDYLIRYGGEEFIVLFSRTSLEEAIKLANRIRLHLEKTTKHGSVKKSITCSGGLVFWEPSKPFISAEKFVDQADLELYKAKKRGRNCIVVAEVNGHE